MRHISSEYFFVIVTLIAYGVAGGFAILPFRRSLRFGILAAPLAGILCVTLGMAVFYGIAGLTVQRALLASWIGCSLTTIAALVITRPKVPWRDVPGLLAAFLVTAPVVSRMVDVASIKEHGPALHYADATDQIGYAQAADWLRTHPVSEYPHATPRSPYNAWLTVLFQIDPRFGSHFFLASISMVRDVSGAFSFDVATAVCLAAALLAAAGVFARSWESLLVILLGLLVCHWYEDTRLGYLGKVLGYPAMILAVGLFMALPPKPSLESVLVLTLLSAAAAIVHSGSATALFITTVCGAFLPARAALARRGERKTEAQSLWHSGILLALMVGTAVMASGIPARPVPSITPDFNVRWPYIFPRLQDLEHQGANIGNNPNDHLPPLAFGREEKLVSGLKYKTVRLLAKISVGMWIGFLLLALARKDPAAIALLLGPLILLLAFWIADKKPEAFQLVGVLYPLTVCGIAQLVGLPAPAARRHTAQWPAVALVVAIAFIGLRVPRFAGSLKRYAGADRPRSQEFTLRHMSRIIGAAGSQPVELNILSVPHLLLAMVELTNHGVQVQFTPQSYYSAFAYMPWPFPDYPPPRMKLMLETDDRPPGWRVKLHAAPYKLLVPE